MKSSRKILALLFILGLTTYTSAQENKIIVEDDVPNTIMFVSKNKANEEVVKVMNNTKPPYFREPGAPRFLLTDQKGKFALGIGGCLQAVAEYDFGGICKDIDFFPSFIPTKGATPVKNQFQMDITTSTLFLKMVGRTNKLGDIVFYTAGNFRGSDNTFQLLNCYIQFLGFTFG